MKSPSPTVGGGWLLRAGLTCVTRENGEVVGEERVNNPNQSVESALMDCYPRRIIGSIHSKFPNTSPDKIKLTVDDVCDKSRGDE